MFIHATEILENLEEQRDLGVLWRRNNKEAQKTRVSGK
jgi:hypothetical protein